MLILPLNWRRYCNDARGLLTNINYSVPTNSNIAVTPSVSFSYDNLGNRTSVTDGLGSKTYEYDQLSQLTAETRQFSDVLTAPTVPANGFRLEYVYNLGGQLKSYKDPYNRQFDFGLDKTGRPTSVNGTAYAGVTNYSSNNQYRAFGAVKQVTYGNQTTATMTYNNRLQPSNYRLTDGTQTLFGKDYFYTTGSNNDNDGLIKKSVHFDDTQSVSERAKRTQVNTFDSQGRITTSETGEGGYTPFGASTKNGPYQQSYTYDAFGNLTGKNDMDFGNNIIGCTGCPRFLASTETIVNNRTQSSYYSANYIGRTITDYQYDADGRLLIRDGLAVQSDAAGRTIFLDATGTNPDDRYTYDGNGDLAKWVQTWSPASTDAPFVYYLKSTVFGANVLELDRTGAMAKEYVFSSTGSRLAYLKNNEVIWLHSESSGKESYEIKQDRTANSKQTYDPTGVTATSNGYSGGGSCPPNSCYSEANSSVMGFMNLGNRGLEILIARRQEQLFQDTMLTLVGFGIFADPTRPPNPDQLHDDYLRYSASGNIFGNSFFPVSTPRPQYGESAFGFSADFATGGLQTRDLNPYNLPELLKDAEEIIKNAKGDCATLLGKNALAKFQKGSKQIEYDPNNYNVPIKSDARTNEETGNIYLNPKSRVFNPNFRTPYPTPENATKAVRKTYEEINKGRVEYARVIKESGVDSYTYAVASIIHEFLHVTKKFPPDNDGSNNKESLRNQQEVIDKCFKEQKPK